MEECKQIYLTVDMDVLDPAFAPAVQNPEPGGIATTTLLEILNNLCDKRLIGFDVVEVSPKYDNGISAIQSAKIIFEILSYLDNLR